MHEAFANITSAIEWRVLLVLALLAGIGVAILAAVNASSGPTSIALGGIGATVAFAVLYRATANKEVDAITGDKDLHEELEQLATEYRNESNAFLNLLIQEQTEMQRVAARYDVALENVFHSTGKFGRIVAIQRAIRVMFVVTYRRSRVHRAFRMLSAAQQRERQIVVTLAQLDPDEGLRPREGQEHFVFPEEGRGR